MSGSIHTYIHMCVCVCVYIYIYIYIYIHTYSLLSALEMALSYMFHICALSSFTFAIWAVAILYQYSCKHPDDGHKCNQNVCVNCNI